MTGKTLPKITVVIPTLNSGKTLSKCLDSVIQLHYPKNKIQILIIDGGSRDNTLRIAEQYPVKILIEKRKSRGLAYNIGLKESRGEYVAYLDSDAIAAENWLMKAVKILQADTTVAAVHFRNKAPPNSSYFQKCVDVLQTKSWGQANGAVYRKSALEHVGGFQEYLPYLQESELKIRLINAGYKVKLARKPVIYHTPRESIMRYFIQSIEAGIGSAKFYIVSRYNKILMGIFARSLIIVLPLFWLLSLLFFPIFFWILFPFLICLAAIYLIYLYAHTDKEYKAIKYLVPALMLMWISSLGNLIGVLWALFHLKNP
jgi:glycosyltransferase involved in cell wall biosynthesis